MSNAKPWMKYISMPYRMGGNPRNSKSTDCIRLVLCVLEDAGLNPPAVEKQWYKWLAERNLEAIKADWFALTEQTMQPEQYAMTLLPAEGDFCIAIVVDEGLLTVSASLDAVMWVPLHSLRPLNYRRLKNV